MIIKPRSESVELMLFRSLHLRMKLSEKDVNYYFYLEKGFEGELQFDKFCEILSNEYLILNDLLFEVNSTTFQIDSLLISQNAIFLFEVKNYDGDYYIEGDEWYSIFQKEIKNPVRQLKRSESLFRRLLQDLGISYSIESYVVFVNPGFLLYQAPMNLPIIFPNQINRFLDKLNTKPRNLTSKHTKLAEKLVSMHVSESPYTKVPDYSYEQLEKGITCGECRSFSTSKCGKILVCGECGCTENIETAVLRSIEEFKLLFPTRNIKISTIYDWCKVIESKKALRRILAKNFTLLNHGNSSYYVPQIQQP